MKLGTLLINYLDCKKDWRVIGTFLNTTVVKAFNNPKLLELDYSEMRVDIDKQTIILTGLKGDK